MAAFPLNGSVFSVGELRAKAADGEFTGAVNPEARHGLDRMRVGFAPFRSAPGTERTEVMRVRAEEERERRHCSH
jgi:hypothetical protein